MTWALSVEVTAMKGIRVIPAAPPFPAMVMAKYGRTCGAGR
jgi:hypothetical protein